VATTQRYLNPDLYLDQNQGSNDEPIDKRNAK
jgi:hypothetical protein